MPNRDFLFLNLSGDFTSIHQRIEAEGYKCMSWYTKEPDVAGRGNGKGMIDIVDDMFDVLKEYADKKEELIILIDDNSQGDMCDYLRKEGWKVIGSSAMSDEMEHSRGKGNELAEECGLDLPESKHFTTYDQCVGFLEAIKEKDTPLFFKGDGVEMAGSSFTYGSESVDDMIRYVKWVATTEKGKKCNSFEIQYTVQGIEADFACWFNGEKFAPAVAVDFEQKRIHGLGQAEGCTGQICFYVDPSENKYFEDHMQYLPEHIKGTGANEWAFNNIIDEKEHIPYFLEFTPRFGWDSTFGELALLQDAGHSIGEFFIMLAEKKPFPKDYFPFGKYSAAVRFYSGGIGRENDECSGKPVFWKPEVDKNLWWYSIKKEDDGYVTTGNIVGVATAVGDTIDEAIKKVYDIVVPKNEYLNTPDIFYSETIGEKVQENIDRLKEWEYL